MTKVMLAALAAITLTSLSILPASAQSNYPNRQPNKPDSHYSCDEQLGYLKRVYPAEVAGIDNHDRVWITEVCASFEGLRNEGNAAYLRTTIAKNEVLTDALRSKAFSANDVYAVRMMGDDTINLYVFHYR